MADAATALQRESETAEAAATWNHVLLLPCTVTVDLPVAGFRTRDVLALGPQSVIPTNCLVGSDIPLRVNGELIAWGEFEVAGERLVLRLTELA